jgi:hypothetical protein
VCVMRRSNECTILIEFLLIANGAEISRIGGGVKIAKIVRLVQAPR